MKHHNKKKLGKKGFILLMIPYYCSTLKEFKQNMNLEAGANATPWMGADYWLAPHDLFSLLFYRTQDQQSRVFSTTMG